MPRGDELRSVAGLICPAWLAKPLNFKAQLMPDMFSPDMPPLARALPVSALLDDTNRFNFPFFQRKFVWSEDEILQLVNDIDLSLEDMQERARDGQAFPVSSSYFLGSLVSISNQNSAQSSSQPQLIDIVDGQQRIITLSMLDLALELAIKQGWFNGLDEADEQDNSNSNGSGGGGENETSEAAAAAPDIPCPPELRSLLKRRFPSTEFYLPAESGPDGNGGSQEAEPDFDADGNAILQGWKTILQGIEGLGADRLPAYRAYMAQNCWVVQVTAPDEADGYQIFINLNTKGRQLDDAEEYRAEVLGNISDRTQRQKLTKDWDSWKRQLGSGFEGRAGLFAQIAHLNAASPKSISHQIRRLYQSRGGVSFMEEVFLPCAEAFDILRSPTLQASVMHRKARSHERKVIRLIKLLNLLPYSDWMPVAMAWLLGNGNRFDDAESVAFFTALERLAHMMLLRRIAVRKRRSIFRHAIRALPVFSGPAAKKQKQTAIDALSRRDARHNAQVLKKSAQLYKLGNDVARLVLYRVHLHTKGGEPVAPQTLRQMSVEHVLPQAENLPADSPWRKAFPDSQKRLRLAHCTGNLTLLSKDQNSLAGHDPFPQKRKLFFATGPNYMKPIPHSEDFKVRQWGEKQILTRYEHIMKDIKQVWDIKQPIPKYRP